MAYTYIETEKHNGLFYIYKTDKDRYNRRVRCCECKQLTDISAQMCQPTRHFCQECWIKVLNQLNEMKDLKTKLVVEAI